MRITHCDDYEDLSARAAEILLAEIGAKPDLLLCAATGQSPLGLYEALVRRSATDPALFERLRVLKLDEWGGFSGRDPGSCDHYLRTYLLDPLGIPADRHFGFDATVDDPAAECERVQAELERQGPVDVCVLGLGVNGHIGFNEPGLFLTPDCHVEQLSETTRSHPMLESRDRAPSFGLTLGLREVLAARRILLLVVGDGKRDAALRLLSGEVSTMLPASLLWLHRNVDCLIDRRILRRPSGSSPS